MNSRGEQDSLIIKKPTTLIFLYFNFFFNHIIYKNYFEGFQQNI